LVDILRASSKYSTVEVTVAVVVFTRNLTFKRQTNTDRPAFIITIYSPMILPSPRLPHFIGGKALHGGVGGRGPWTLLGP
jgi:hypothetical protein